MKFWYFVLLTTFLIFSCSRAQSQEGKIYHLLIGMYTSGKSESIYVYAFNIDTQSGKLKLIGRQPSLGISPRNFMIDPTGHFVLVANEKSDDIFIFKRNIQTGLLTATGKKIEVGNPVCLVMTPKD